ncbi:MAG: tRNA (adenosine(37)-N6)-dimethylallyltransferase MiaA [bacterium]
MTLAPGAYYLVGPTASGKTACAQKIAEQTGADVLNADAMLVYRNMDIGTAKPSSAERAAVRYGGLDLVSPSEPCSVTVWLAAARVFAAETQHAGRALLVVGGTGFYLKALTEGLHEGTAPDQAVRAHWQTVYDQTGVAGLQSELRTRGALAMLPPGDMDNPRRLIRALERTSDGATALPSNWVTPVAMAIAPTFAGLAWSRDDLALRIEARVDAMFAAGMLDEVARLLPAGLASATTARQAIGYAEAIEVLSGQMPLAVARERIAARTRQLAKRQRTWFRHQAQVIWIEADQKINVETLAEQVYNVWQQTGPAPWPE